eukprot:TRINITY_DN5573_c0_g1_i2.p1 TRINITY_DN5573_c0_g1~~TRINITY_DN5573_c0_g1_i2.p1  ORF type:complete len:500 (+),score=118.50 TRINITY_DN5573_c0_g1_i2:135-1634(+)
MLCTLSGSAPEHPVVSAKSGHIFERRLIEQYIETHGKDPVNDQPLTTADLVEIKGLGGKATVKPRPVAATSIPSMLQLFQNEWDALMLETYTLKDQLDKVRQELSHALYQHDAACRVIARLIKERDHAKSELANARVSLPSSSGNGSSQQDVDMQSADAGGLDEEIIDRMTKRSAELSASRRKRAVSETLASSDNVSTYHPVASNPVHKASTPGVTCLDIHSTHHDLIVSGGADAAVVLSNKTANKIVATLTGHSKKINKVQFASSSADILILSASQDRTARIWHGKEEGEVSAGHVFRAHNDDVTSVSFHPLGDYFVSASLDKTWAFHDVHSGRTLRRVEDQQIHSGYHSCEFHPDGLILATGAADATVRIWDAKSHNNVATFEGHTGPISDISFSENGFYLATASLDGVKLWDLRKLKNFLSIPATSDAGVHAVSFDRSGTFLAMAGSDIQIVHGKTFSPLQTYTDHTAAVTDIKFGHDASWFASSSLDRTVKIWAQ